jgi:hypothetical protein
MPLLDLDPGEEVLSADRVEEGWMVGRHMAPDSPDDVVIAVATSYEPAFASDRLCHRTSL